MNSCMLEFEDGFRTVTSRNAIRKANPRYALAHPNVGEEKK
jgi:hypothetical protein